MKSKLKIKKGDKVIVISGKDIKKQGEVIRVFPSVRKVLVSGVNLVVKHTKPTQHSPGGKVIKESPIDISNVAFLDPLSSKPTKVGYKILENGDKVRVSKSSGEIIS